MAGNLVRQGRLKDSVRYYRAAVEADPGFGDAWADLAMVYREVGHFAPAHKAAEAALETDPGRSLYHHVRGEVFFAEAWDLLEGSDDYETLREGGKLAGRAVTAFGRAIELAEADERLAARADSFFRLGEICYFINQDRLGARAYWARILDLHAPGPMLFEVTHAPDDSVRSEALESYARLTEMELELETWKRWAREYLAQLDREPDPAAEAPPAGAPRPTLPDSARESGAPSSAPQPDPVRTAPTAPYAPQGEYLRPGYGSAPALREPPARTPGRAGRGKSFRIFD
jgi:tetratricopeptide (TPR) repeat protein